MMILLSNPSVAQIKDITALKARIPALRGSTERVTRYARLGMLYTNQSLDPCHHFGARALDLAKRINDKLGGPEALNVLAFYYQEKANPYPTYKYIDASPLAERQENQRYSRELRDLARNTELENEKTGMGFLQYRRTVALLSVAIGLLSAGFSFLVFRLYRNKRRLAKRQEEINGRLEAQYKQLEDNNAFHQKLISIISHDLRQPLSSMLMLGEGGMVDRMSDSQRQYVFDQVSQNARTSLQAMDGLVHWMKLNTVGLAYTPSAVNLKETIRAALAYNRMVADQKGIVVMDFIPETIDVLAQSEMLLFVSRNILSNALRHTPSGGRIVLTVVEEDGGSDAMVRIADSGSGIPTHLLPHLFDKERSDGASGGSGLALIICHEMIDRMKGRIWATNNPEGGASFCYRLPLAVRLDGDMPNTPPPLAESQTQSID